MSRIYENVFIGNFIYACGRFTGAKEQNSSVNLYQQTPNDKSIGDLLLSHESRAIILEFKKDEVDLVTELRKPHREELIANLNIEINHNDNRLLESVSSRAHFLAFPDNSFQLRFCSYFEYFNSRKKNSFYDFNKFIQEFYEPDVKNLLFQQPEIGVGMEDFCNYISFMNMPTNKDVADSIGGLMIATGENREMLLVPFEGIRQLTTLLLLPVPESIAIKKIEEVKEKIKEKLTELEEPPQQIEVQASN